MFLSHIKKQASCFIQEKYKTARLAFTDVTSAELLAEEATSNSSLGPDAKTMTTIAEASFHVDDFWRIVDVLHRRLYTIEWKHWRQSYKALVLLEFLLTHGPEDFGQEFQCDLDVIQQLATFQYIDDNGFGVFLRSTMALSSPQSPCSSPANSPSEIWFDWGRKMKEKSEWAVELLRGGEALKEARVKALKITREIRGFGNSISLGNNNNSSSSSCSSPYDPSSPSACSTPTSSNSEASTRSSFGSYSSASTLFDANDLNIHEKPWDCPRIEEEEDEEEEDSLLDLSGLAHSEFEEKDGVFSGIWSKLYVS